MFHYNIQISMRLCGAYKNARFIWFFFILLYSTHYYTIIIQDMSKKTNRTAQIFAIFALLWIIVSVIGTGVLVLVSPSHDESNMSDPTVIDQAKLQEIIEASQTTATVTTENGSENMTIQAEAVEGESAE